VGKSFGVMGRGGGGGGNCDAGIAFASKIKLLDDELLLTILDSLFAGDNPSSGFTPNNRFRDDDPDLARRVSESEDAVSSDLTPNSSRDDGERWTEDGL
jgi:hypothetical protein